MTSRTTIAMAVTIMVVSPAACRMSAPAGETVHPGDDDATVAGPTAATTSLVALLPADATVYVWGDVAAMLAAEPPGEVLDRTLAGMPAACSASIADVREIAVAFYAGEPAGRVVVVAGPAPEQMLSCADAWPSLAGHSRRVETRGGREVNVYDAAGQGLFSPGPGVHVLASTELLDRAVETAAGGPSLAGSRVLDFLARVPAGPLAAAAELPPGFGGSVAAGLGALADGEPTFPPPPVGFAAALGTSPEPELTAALVFPDGADADGAEPLVRVGADHLRDLWVTIGASPRIAPPPSPESRFYASVAALLDSVVVSRDGDAVRAVAGPDLTPLEFLVGASALAALALATYHETPHVDEPRIVLAKITALLELASGTDAGGAAPFPTNPRVAGDCAAPDCNAECVPREFRLVAGRSYLPTGTDWMCSSPGPECVPDTVWSEIHFTLGSPIAFQYCYAATGGGDGSEFKVAVFGDLDADGVWSEYSRQGAVIDGRPAISPTAVLRGDE